MKWDMLNPSEDSCLKIEDITSGNWFHEVRFFGDLLADGWDYLGCDHRWGYGHSYDNLTLVYPIDLWSRTFASDTHLELRMENTNRPYACAVP